MRVALLGAALLVSTALVVGAPAAHAQYTSPYGAGITTGYGTTPYYGGALAVGFRPTATGPTA